MLRERVRAVLGRVPEPAKAWLKDHKEIAERSIARVKRKEVVLKEKLHGLRSRASELREWAKGLKPQASTPAPAASTESAPTASE
jgi:hypothetical protein